MKHRVAHGVRLRDVEQADVRWVHKALGAWECSERWDAVWAMTPRPDVLADKLWRNVPWQQVVVVGRKPRALLQMADVNMGSGIGHLELLQAPDAAALADDAIGEFVVKAFELFPLRKVLLMAGADCLTLAESLRARAECVGVFRDHLRRGADAFADLRIYEIWRA